MTTTAARKTRSDAKLEQLSAPQREKLRFWLEEENRSYADVVERVRAEFGLSVGKSAVALYWQRHLLPQRHQDAAEAAAALAALPIAAFDAATVNQARALAWSALIRPQPDVPTAATLLEMVRNAERHALALQRLALEERRVALREAQAGQPSRPPRAASAEKPGRSPVPRQPCSPAASTGQPNSRVASNGKSPELTPKAPEPNPSEPPATLFATSRPPRFPGYSDLLQPPVEAPINHAPPGEPHEPLPAFLLVESTKASTVRAAT